MKWIMFPTYCHFVPKFDLTRHFKRSLFCLELCIRKCDWRNSSQRRYHSFDLISSGSRIQDFGKRTRDDMESDRTNTSSTEYGTFQMNQINPGNRIRRSVVINFFLLIIVSPLLALFALYVLFDCLDRESCFNTDPITPG